MGRVFEKCAIYKVDCDQVQQAHNRAKLATREGLVMSMFLLLLDFCSLSE